MGNHFLYPLILNLTLVLVLFLPNEICPDSISWSDYSPDLYELIADEHEIAHVSCFTIISRGRYKYPVNIARIAFKGQDLPDRVYIGGAFFKVKPYIPPPHQCQNCWRFGHPVKYYRSTAYCPLCATPSRTHINCPSTKHHCAPKNLISSSEAALFTILNWRLLPSTSNMA